MNRFDFKKVEPAAFQAMLKLENYLENTDLEPIQKELIKIRASQLNGCAYCLNSHTRDARALGETERRIYTLSAWRETSYFTAEEKAILALTEEVTTIEKGVSDETYNNALKVLGEQKTAQTIMAAITINAWNRIGVSLRMTPE